MRFYQFGTGYFIQGIFGIIANEYFEQILVVNKIYVLENIGRIVPVKQDRLELSAVYLEYFFKNPQ
jgi:hypothetical protein